jgi:hypothetical protein
MAVNNSYELLFNGREMGRKKLWSEDMQARFPEGTFVRIGAVLEGAEDRTDFVRTAVEKELRRREASSGKKTNTDARPHRRKN